MSIKLAKGRMGSDGGREPTIQWCRDQRRRDKRFKGGSDGTTTTLRDARRAPPSMARIDIAAHAKYFLRCLELLPAPYASLDTNRLTVAYFCVSGLDVLGSVKRVNAARVIEWIYSLQVLPSSDSAESAAAPGRSAGFRGGSFMGGPFSAGGGPSSRRANADPH